MQKVLEVLGKIKSLVAGLIQKAPFTSGVVLGYLGSPVISAGIQVVRGILGLL